MNVLEIYRDEEVAVEIAAEVVSTGPPFFPE